MRYILILIIFFSLALTGCQYPFEFRTEKEIREEILGKDPSFAQVLDKKGKLDEEIRVILEDFNAKRIDLNSEILILKKELKIAKNESDTKIKEIDSQLLPFREELEQKVRELITELKLKESSLYATKKMIAKFNKLLEERSSSENLAKESSKWQDKIAALKIQAEELEEEVSSIRDKVHLNRLKLKLLK